MSLPDSAIIIGAAIGASSTLVALFLLQRRKKNHRMSPQEELEAFNRRIEAVAHLPIREAERALGVQEGRYGKGGTHHLGTH